MIRYDEEGSFLSGDSGGSGNSASEGSDESHSRY
jgi:hypothetical protein